MSLHFAAAAVALLVERLFGYPKLIYQEIGHPVEWIGILLSKMEIALYDPDENQFRPVSGASPH